MTDIVSKQKRSQMMSRVRSKNTTPEKTVRSWLHKKGFRFRLHRKNLPGKPDIVLPKYKATIFVHGCFFHHHEGCKLAYIPKTRTEWWLEKFAKNRSRDKANQQELEELNWNVLVIWECEVRANQFQHKVESFLKQL